MTTGVWREGKEPGLYAADFPEFAEVAQPSRWRCQSFCKHQKIARLEKWQVFVNASYACGIKKSKRLRRIRLCQCFVCWWLAPSFLSFRPARHQSVAHFSPEEVSQLKGGASVARQLGQGRLFPEGTATSDETRWVVWQVEQPLVHVLYMEMDIHLEEEHACKYNPLGNVPFRIRGSSP